KVDKTVEKDGKAFSFTCIYRIGEIVHYANFVGPSNFLVSIPKHILVADPLPFAGHVVSWDRIPLCVCKHVLRCFNKSVYVGITFLFHWIVKASGIHSSSYITSFYKGVQFIFRELHQPCDLLYIVILHRTWVTSVMNMAKDVSEPSYRLYNAIVLLFTLLLCYYLIVILLLCFLYVIFLHHTREHFANLTNSTMKELHTVKPHENLSYILVHIFYIFQAYLHAYLVLYFAYKSGLSLCA
ncbi:hypothetical protein L9F63_016941, partial [Diploptera punctata]